MIYLIEGYSPFSKTSKIEETYKDAEVIMDEWNEMGFITSITPLELTPEQFGESVELAMHQYFEENITDENW